MKQKPSFLNTYIAIYKRNLKIFYAQKFAGGELFTPINPATAIH